MKQVWILTQGTRYDGDDITVVCGSYEKALEEADKLNPEHGGNWTKRDGEDVWLTQYTEYKAISRHEVIE